MVHDARAPNAIRMVDKMGAEKLPFAPRTAWVLDHYSPPPNLAAARGPRPCAVSPMRHGSPLYDIGDGICHRVLPKAAT